MHFKLTAKTAEINKHTNTHALARAHVKYKFIPCLRIYTICLCFVNCIYSPHMQCNNCPTTLANELYSLVYNISILYKKRRNMWESRTQATSRLDRFRFSTEGELLESYIEYRRISSICMICCEFEAILTANQANESSYTPVCAQINN